jgi:predicted dehydrogenase
MKKLKIGMIGGGGDGNFFGGVHRRAIELDATRTVVAGALRSNPEAAMESAEQWDVQGYPDYQALVKACQSGELDLDYITIVTPNHAHFGPAKACLEAGIPVLCEKPMTITVEESEELVRLARDNDVPFVLAHTYTGHPMMMLAKDMVANGQIGEVRKIEAWYTQGWLASKLEDTGLQQATWRTDPGRAGISNCGGDIGTHAFVAATWTTGLDVKRVSARLNTFVGGRELDDDFNVIAEMNNGATAIICATQIAIGYKNDHGFRIYGTEGSLEWHQERAEKLLVRKGETDQTYWLGANFEFWPETIGSYLRTPPGHHEDFFEALANLHCSMERQIRARNGEEVPTPYPHPNAETGLAGMKFVSAAVESSKKDGAWTAVN